MHTFSVRSTIMNKKNKISENEQICGENYNGNGNGNGGNGGNGNGGNGNGNGGNGNDDDFNNFDGKFFKEKNKKMPQNLKSYKKNKTHNNNKKGNKKYNKKAPKSKKDIELEINNTIVK